MSALIGVSDFKKFSCSELRPVQQGEMTIRRLVTAFIGRSDSKKYIC